MGRFRTNPITDEILFIANANGITQRQLALDLGLTERQIWNRVQRGRERFEGKQVPPLELLLSSNPNECAHPMKIRVGQRVICLDCLESGYDLVLAAQRSAATDPKPDVKLPEPGGLLGGTTSSHPSKRRQASTK